MLSSYGQSILYGFHVSSNVQAFVNKLIITLFP